VTDSVAYVAPLNSASKPDVLWIELYSGYGVFQNGIKPGTYELSGAELAYDSCGLCVTITADYDMGSGAWQQDYMATGGTVTITEVTPRFIGTLSNVTFTNANIDYQGGGTTELLDDCASSMNAATYDAWFGATAELKIIGLTDLHGQLNPLFGKGGAPVLATLIGQERNSCTLVVGAGDMVGASEPLSSFFSEQPTIKALNLIVSTPRPSATTEFDKGLTALNSLVTLAEFDYTSSNLTNIGTELPGAVAPYVIYDVLDIKVAVIGITDTDLAAVTLPANLGTLAVLDQTATIAAAQAARAAAATAGATIFIGVFHAGAAFGGTPAALRHRQRPDRFDAIVGGHSHIADVDTTAATGGALLVQPNIKGQSYPASRSRSTPRRAPSRPRTR